MTLAPKPYGSRRGITPSDVSHAADTLLRAGERPTIERLRATLGGGSPNTLGPMLDAWWKTIAARLDSGPAALHRLPESVAHICEALWMQALDEGRSQAAQELGAAGRKLDGDLQTLEFRSHVLTLREGEMEARLHDREQESAAMLSQLKGLTSVLRQAQLTGEAQARRIAQLESELTKAREQWTSLVAAPPASTSPKPRTTGQRAGERRRVAPRRKVPAEKPNPRRRQAPRRQTSTPPHGSSLRTNSSRAKRPSNKRPKARR